MEYSEFWQNNELAGIGLLKASFQQFSFSKHWHDELAIGVIEEGAEGLNYRGNNIIIPENQIVAINPSEVHTGFSGSDFGWTYRMFYFDLQMIKQYFSAIELSVIPIIKQNIIDDPDLFSLLQQLHIALEKPSLKLSKETLLSFTFEILFNRYGDSSLPQKTVLKEHEKNYLIREYIINHWQENITLSELSAQSGQNQFQLIRSFSQQYGLTPHQFLLLTKTNHAKALLLSGASCIEAALTCGFFDQSHLNRNFKRVYGVSPKQYSVSSIK